METIVQTPPASAPEDVPSQALTRTNPMVEEGAHTDVQITYTTNAEGKRIKQVIRKKRRPARPQVDEAVTKSEPPPQTGTIFNIWYNKWSGGDREDSYLSQTHAKGRCNVKGDSGYTRADSSPGAAYFCMFFAKGLCPRGRECEYLHRLPTSVHDIYSGNVDCFGRDKHSDYRDDMGGVGSFMRQNRTLYVGRIHPTDDIEEVVARHFSEWGPIERIRVLPTRGVAFVTYKTESLAQFAKEAMAHQSLDHDEVLNVRWATVDPNPASQKREARKIEEQAAEAIKRAVPEAFLQELEGSTEAKQRRKDEGNFGLEGYEASDDVWYTHQSIGSLGPPPEKKLLEQGAMEEIEEARHEQDHGLSSPGAPQQIQEHSQSGGLFGTSTLAALGSYRPSDIIQASASKQDPLSKPALIDYGSDEE